MAWQDATAWTGNWTLNWQGQRHAWDITGVSFDEAYRSAIAGAAAVLSGHAQPRFQAN